MSASRKGRTPRGPWLWACLLLLLPIGLEACGSSQQVASGRGASPVPTPSASATLPAASPSPAASPAAEPALSLPPPPQAPGAPNSSLGPIYLSHSHGYDVSYPQCSTVRSPSGAAFGVVGVNNGRAFTTNPCLGAEWQAATPPRAVYFNSGYKPDNYTKTTADCRQRSTWQNTGPDGQEAYAIGCSEAEFALSTLVLYGANSTVMIWIDVESANSWSDVNLNRLALQAEIDELAAYGRIVGLYSTPDLWRQIVGSWNPNGVVADWEAGLPPSAACAAPGFSGHPVWLAQEDATWPGLNYDSDWAC